MKMSLYRVFLNFQIELAGVISLYYDQIGSFVKDFVMVILKFCSPCDILSPGWCPSVSEATGSGWEELKRGPPSPADLWIVNVRERKRRSRKYVALLIAALMFEILVFFL